MGEWNANGNYNSGRSYGDYSEADSYRGSYDSYDNGMSGRHYVRGHYSRSDGNEMVSKEIEKKMRDVDRDERKILEKAMEILEQ